MAKFLRNFHQAKRVTLAQSALWPFILSTQARKVVLPSLYTLATMKDLCERFSIYRRLLT